MSESSRRTPTAYSQRTRQELILRDLLALDRTVLANERTLMAYVRTALALLVGGATLIHFFDDPIARLLGVTMLPFAPTMLAWGTWRYLRVRGHLRRAGRNSDA